jgi:hypothetical protein
LSCVLTESAWDLFVDPSARDAVSPFVEQLWQRGATHERRAIEKIGEPFLDLSGFELLDRGYSLGRLCLVARRSFTVSESARTAEWESPICCGRTVVATWLAISSRAWPRKNVLRRGRRQTQKTVNLTETPEEVRMPNESINKLTVYKLAPVILSLTKIPGYTLVADGKWKHRRTDYSYRLFFHKDGPHPPSWLAVFNPLNLKLAKKDIPQTMNSGFILLLEVGGVLFGITGGIGHIHLRKSLTIEHRFGLELAERILALPELRGLTQRDTSGVVNALDRAFRGVYNPEGDINNLKRVLTHVRGTLQKTNPLQATIGKSIQASDALTVNGSKKFEDIIRLLLETK